MRKNQAVSLVSLDEHTIAAIIYSVSGEYGFGQCGDVGLA